MPIAITAALALSMQTYPGVESIESIDLPNGVIQARLDDAGNIYYGFDDFNLNPGDAAISVRRADGVHQPIFTLPENGQTIFTQIIDVAPNGRVAIGTFDTQFTSYRYSHDEGLSLIVEQEAISVIAPDGRAVYDSAISLTNPAPFTIVDPDGLQRTVQPPSGLLQAVVNDINADGTFVGEAGVILSGDTPNRGFTYTEAGGYELLPDLPLQQDAAWHINNRGDIVALSSTRHPIGDSHVTEQRAYVITGDTGEIIEIESLPNFGHESVFITDFNDNGVALGTSRSIHGSDSGYFLYTPQDGTIPLDDFLISEANLLDAHPFALNNNNELLVATGFDGAGFSGFDIIQLTNIPAPGTSAMTSLASLVVLRRRRGAHSE